jgi:hypothetical protein
MNYNGEVFVAKSKRLADYLEDKGFKLKRKSKCENRENAYVYIFNNSTRVQVAVEEYFRQYNTQQSIVV